MFNIQDPRYENSVLLNEVLLEACENAVYGAGTYAFVSADGIKLLMMNSVFEKFINGGPYFLLMGMDEITNTRSLSEAEAFCHLYPNLQVRAFIHHTVGSTFHPKFSWFRYEKGGILVLGSGNLTAKGLRRNTEAFVVQRLNAEEIDAVESKWNDWVDSSIGCIKTMDDPEVVKRAEENTKKTIEKIMNKHFYEKEQTIIECKDEQDAWGFDLNSDVLIAEIPIGLEAKRKDGFYLNVEPEIAENFFGIESHTKSEIVLRKVSPQGFLADIETSFSFLTPSKKYQIECAPSEKVGYTGKGSLMGIFVKLSVRTFIYMIIMPENRGYSVLKDELNNYRWDINHLVQHQTDVKALKELAGYLPILEYLK